MLKETIEVSGSAASVFTFLQINVPTPGSNDNLRYLVVSGIIAVASNLILKAGNQIIARIGRKKRIRKAKQNHDHIIYYDDREKPQ